MPLGARTETMSVSLRHATQTEFVTVRVESPSSVSPRQMKVYNTDHVIVRSYRSLDPPHVPSPPLGRRRPHPLRPPPQSQPVPRARRGELASETLPSFSPRVLASWHLRGANRSSRSPTEHPQFSALLNVPCPFVNPTKTSIVF